MGRCVLTVFDCKVLALAGALMLDAAGARHSIEWNRRLRRMLRCDGVQEMEARQRCLPLMRKLIRFDDAYGALATAVKHLEICESKK